MSIKKMKTFSKFLCKPVQNAKKSQFRKNTREKNKLKKKKLCVGMYMCGWVNETRKIEIPVTRVCLSPITLKFRR